MAEVFNFFCDFSFENDYQKLSLQIKGNETSLLYKVEESSNIDCIPSDSKSSWVSYEGDPSSWISAFDLLHTHKWKESYLPEDEFSANVKWNLSVERLHGKTPADTLKYSYEGSGENAYPHNFTDFLELLRLLLNIPVFLIEL